MMREDSHSMKNSIHVTNKKMKLLVVGNKERFIHLKYFLSKLDNRDFETKLIHDLDYIEKFFDLNFFKKNKLKKEFEKILDVYKPDIVLFDRISKIAKIIISKNIPIWILLRGNYWKEVEWALKTNTSKRNRLAIKKNQDLVDECFKNCELILPISKYLENEVKKRYPNKKTRLFQADGRNPDEWRKISSNKLKHPCVGLLQGLNIWGKTQELLVLKQVVKELPNVTFYLAGDGVYRDKIIPELKNEKNFVWLQQIDYPNGVKEFLSEIDVFMLLSGLEGLGQTIIEALLMKKPVIATNVGGIPELIINEETGLLVNRGNSEEIVKNILRIFHDENFSKKMAENGHTFVKNEFSWENIATKFESILKEQKSENYE